MASTPKIRIVNDWRVSLKLPYYAVVDGQTLQTSQGVLRKFSSRDAAIAAAIEFANDKAIAK